MHSVDLNADLGEHPGSNLDEQIMPYISSCNIACGGHIGDYASVRETVLLAKHYQVAVGAHPSYPDLKHFGRRIIHIEPQSLADSIAEQLSLVKRICSEEDVELNHVKPHGALYNHAALEPFISELIFHVIDDITPGVSWMGFANSASERVATDKDHPFIAEGFADRRYEPDGTLRSREQEGAVLKEKEVIEQVQEIAINHRVWANGWLPVNVQSICLHGDTAGAVTLAKKINHHLVSKGVQIVAV